MEVHGLQGSLELFFRVTYFVKAIITSANRTLSFFTINCLIDPLGLGALNAEESRARLTVVSDVLEIELGFTDDTLGCLDSLCNKFFYFRCCR